jgi:hypothetical protein
MAGAVAVTASDRQPAHGRDLAGYAGTKSKIIEA